LFEDLCESELICSMCMKCDKPDIRLYLQRLTCGLLESSCCAFWVAVILSFVHPMILVPLRRSWQYLVQRVWRNLLSS